MLLIFFKEQIEEIRSELLLFGYHLPNNAVVMDKALRICNQYQLNAEEFASEYIAFAYCKELPNELSQDRLDIFVRQLKKATASKKGNKVNQFLSNSYASDHAENISQELLAVYGVQSTNSPSIVRLDSVSEAPTESVLLRFGESSGTNWMYRIANRNILVRPFDSSFCLKRTNRYMCQKCEDVSLCLAAKMEQLEQLALKDVLPPGSFFSRLGTVSDDSIYVCGQLLSVFGCFRDNPLDLSIQGALGDLLKLDLSLVSDCSLFPGQIAAVHGTGKRGEFCATAFYAGVLPPAVEVNLSETVDHLSVFIAAGSFVSRNDFKWQPLRDLLNICKTHNPDILLLIGPFVSEKCNVIERVSKVGSEKCFAQIISIISTALSGSRTTVIVISSGQDILAEPVFPCPPYSPRRLPMHPKILFFSDPSILRINGLTFAVTSTDVVRHLSAEEIFIGTSSEPRMDRILKHLLLQRSFYPLYPSAMELNLDIIALSRYGQLPILPNFCITPSDCQFFIKEIHNCIFINPGRSAKRIYSRLEVNINREFSHNADLKRFISAEIVRF
ncbi:DNA directed DNA polymerase alpha 2 [Trichuris trichiura]|uniref:DNA polymerase alpha subunit B n=1 Tax=Trichuris trichiura TaxID=36087 RepID=A0A077ZID1_TRITR|nr:DNA directed DNA polymerase alpha 2 [Trichuris trichiura]